MLDKEIIRKIKPGAKVKVYSSLSGEVLPPFEGMVIARRHGKEKGATFTVRSIISGIGVEKIFPIYSPVISKVEIIYSPRKARKAKLYWIRSASGSKIRKRLGVSI